MSELDDYRGFKERLVVDTSEQDPVYMLVGKGGAYMRLSPSAYQLLYQRSLGVSFTTLAEMISSQSGDRVSPEELKKAYLDLRERIDLIEEKYEKKRFGFWVKLPFIPENIVARISEAFSVLYRPSIVRIAAAVLIFSVIVSLSIDLSINLLPMDFFGGYVLFFFSLFFHEFGHASASFYYGVRPREIGFTIYLIYPAFYSNVSSTWELKRRQRVVVDLGGFYFQLIVAVIFLWMYLYSDWEPLKAAILLILGSCIFSLNPIFKYDGYWLLSDALGVTNLGEQPSKIVRYAINKIRGFPTKPLPWPPLTTKIMIIYTAMSFAVWGCFAWILFPILFSKIMTYPEVAASFAIAIVEPPHTPGFEKSSSFFISTQLVIIAFIMFCSFAIRVWKLLYGIFLLARSNDDI